MITLNLKVLKALKEQREGRTILWKDVSETTGVGRRTLRRLADGRAKGVYFETLEALATYFACGPGDLLVEVEGERPRAYPAPRNRGDVVGG